MYTKQRWEELQAKNRSELSWEHLYWLSRYDPKPTDGHHLETKIYHKVSKAKDFMNNKMGPLQITIAKISKKLSLY